MPRGDRTQFLARDGVAGDDRRGQLQGVHYRDHVVAKAIGDIDPSKLLPSLRATYRYAGSLTTPPCTEGVRWQLMQSPTPVSDAQVKAFNEIIKPNARPVQPVKARDVLKELVGAEGKTIKHDISLPIALIPEFVEAISARLLQDFALSRMVVFGHVGDGNLHFNVSAPPDDPGGAALAAAGDRIRRAVHDLVAASGGSTFAGALASRGDPV